VALPLEETMSTPGEAKAKEKPQTAGQLLIRSLVQRGGVVSLADTLKQTHQSIDSVAIMKPVTEFSVAVNAPDAAGEAVANAFRAAMILAPGASIIALRGGRAWCRDGSQRTTLRFRQRSSSPERQPPLS